MLPQHAYNCFGKHYCVLVQCLNWLGLTVVFIFVIFAILNGPRISIPLETGERVLRRVEMAGSIEEAIRNTSSSIRNMSSVVTLEHVYLLLMLGTLFVFACIITCTIAFCKAVNRKTDGTVGIEAFVKRNQIACGLMALFLLAGLLVESAVSIQKDAGEQVIATIAESASKEESLRVVTPVIRKMMRDHSIMQLLLWGAVVMNVSSGVMFFVNVITAIPQEVEKNAGRSCVTLPHGRG